MSRLRIRLVITAFIFAVCFFLPVSALDLSGQVQRGEGGTFPAAHAGPDIRVYANDPVILDASRSKGADITVKWDYDDRDGVEDDISGLMVKHVYKKPGGYVATATVTDNLGRSSWDKCFIEVLTKPGEGVNLVDNFEGGQAGQVLQLGNHFRCSLIHTAAWRVRIDNCANIPLRFRVYGAYSKTLCIEGFRAKYSYEFDGQEWFDLDDANYVINPEDKAIDISVTFPRSPVYLGWHIQYTPVMLHNFLSNLPERSYIRIEYIGKTVEGRDIPMVTIGEPESGIEPLTIGVVGGQHATEIAGGPISEGMISFLCSDDPIARQARGKMYFKIIPVLNLDGFANDWSRYNAHHIDLNRNWNYKDDTPIAYGPDQDSPFPEPEVAAVQQAFQNWIAQGYGVEVLMDIHNHSCGGPGVLIVCEQRPQPEQGTPEREFYEKFTLRHLPTREVRYAKEFGTRTAYCADYGRSLFKNRISFTWESNPCGWGPENEPLKYPATRKNFRFVGEQLARACIDYVNCVKEEDKSSR